jgi:uncharacterized protein with HEPN domain
MKDRILFIIAAYECIQSIEEYIADYQLDDFLQDKKTQDAVLRNLEVLGQTIKDFSVNDLKLDFPDVKWSQVAAMRNIIAHEYLGIDKMIIWQTISLHLTPVKAAIEEVIRLHHNS